MNNENQGNELQLVDEHEIQQLIQNLPKATISKNKVELIKYQGFWHPNIKSYLKGILLYQRHFEAINSDIIIASFPKTGTTWLKSLLFMVINRFNYPKDENPLLKNHPHELVPRLEVDIYSKAFEYPIPQHLKELPSPRLLHTHFPYISQPKSIKTSECRILYITRNPLDTAVSMYYFLMGAMKNMKGKEFEPFSIEDVFEEFYEGKMLYGPFFEHVIEYWKESLQRPNKVLFLKYEDLKNDTKFWVKKIGEFVGVPFSLEEESEGAVEDVIKMCSIGNLQGLKVNRSGVNNNKVCEKKSYFRKGEVGDWKNHMTPLMVERMNKLMQEKLEGTGLSFETLPSK